MWFDLPNELRTLIFDFFGDTSIRKHRLHRFVCAELATLFLGSQAPARYYPPSRHV